MENRLDVDQISKVEGFVVNLKRTIKLDEDYFREENAELPSDDTISKTLELLKLLAFHNLWPEKVTTSIEGGVCIIFSNLINRLYLEFYNDGDISYIIEDFKNKTVLESEELANVYASHLKILKFFS